MTVANTEPVFYRRFSGFTEKHLPEGWWWGRVEVTGDASGGQANLSLAFAPVSAAKSSRIFNLEQMSFRTDDVGAGTIQFQGSNFVGPGGNTLLHVWGDALVNGQTQSFLSGASQSALPIFLGSANLQTLQAAYTAVMGNSNLDVFVFEAQGYWWGPRSILVPGGPQRPPFPMYGA